VSEQQIDLSRVPAGHGGDPSPASTAEHGSSGLPVGSTTAMWGLLAAFVAVWFAYGAIADAGKAVQIDLAEAYVWGREFQLGYNQHPPFWAWIAGVWFMAFPHTNWAFVLLAVLNSAIGLAGAWRIMGRFANGWQRQAAIMLLLCTPFYTFKCYLYNANSIFLSLWPWTCYFFVRSIDTRRTEHAVLFGTMVGLCLLSKYYAIVLILTCLGASFAHPAWRQYYRSASPWIAVATTTVLFLPHAVWALLSDAPPVQYALGLTGIGVRSTIGYTLNLLLEVTLFHVVVVAIVLLSRRRGTEETDVAARTPHRAFLTALAFLPLAFTLLFGLCFEIPIAPKMLIGMFPLAPLWLLQVVPSVNGRWVFRRAAFVAVGTAAVALIASPAIAYSTFTWNRKDPDWLLPKQELAREATRLWHRETHAPLRFVGGSSHFGNSVAFYSTDRPSGFVLLDFRQAPWVTPQALWRDGLLAVCMHEDAACVQAATRLMHADTTHMQLSLKHSFWGREREPVTIEIFINPPHPETQHGAG
jgi:hypothetical protein